MRTKISFQWALALLALLSASNLTLYGQGRDLGSVASSHQTAAGTTAEEQKPALTLGDRADLHMARKEYGDAADSYIQALRQPGLSADDDASLWNRLGIAYQAELKYGPARKAYKKSLHFRKDFAEPWNNLGTTYYMQNKYGKSVKYYERAIRLNGESASMHMNLGTSYYHLNHFDKAVLEYRAALVLDPNILTKHSAMGTVVETREGDPKYYYYLAKTFANLGRVDEAVHYLRRAFEDGFNDLKQLNEDPDFKKINQAPEYVELLKNPPVAIKE
jgi:tetratricopeptide (TPR) repeat protein